MLTRRALLLSAAAWGGAAHAQQVQSQILIVDSERVFRDSLFGRRVAAEVEAQSAELAQENQRIAAALAEEERDLTAQRPELPPEDFRALAEAYDLRVQETRRAQIAKSEALDAQVEAEERAFFSAAAPVLETLMREAGAAVVLEKDRVLLSATAIDITDAAITRIDAAIGDGS
ncbi:MAG: OmpH family outer membrane protein [Pseudomonadota bacterium]